MSYVIVYLQSVLLVVVAYGANRISVCPAATAKSQPVRVSNIILPHIKLRKGYRLPVKFDLETKVPLPDRIRVDVYLKRKMFWWIPIPCIATFGSCSYRVDNTNCMALKKYNINCKIPGNYKFDHIINVPNIIVPSMVVSGLYRIDANIYDEITKKKLLCIEAEVNVST